MKEREEEIYLQTGWRHQWRHQWRHFSWERPWVVRDTCVEERHSDRLQFTSYSGQNTRETNSEKKTSQLLLLNFLLLRGTWAASAAALKSLSIWRLINVSIWKHDQGPYLANGNGTDFGPHLDHKKGKSWSKLAPNTEFSTQLNYTLPFFLTHTVWTLTLTFLFQLWWGCRGHLRFLI